MIDRTIIANIDPDLKREFEKLLGEFGFSSDDVIGKIVERWISDHRKPIGRKMDARAIRGFLDGSDWKKDGWGNYKMRLGGRSIIYRLRFLKTVLKLEVKKPGGKKWEKIVWSYYKDVRYDREEDAFYIGSLGNVFLLGSNSIPVDAMVILNLRCKCKAAYRFLRFFFCCSVLDRASETDGDGEDWVFER